MPSFALNLAPAPGLSYCPRDACRYEVASLRSTALCHHSRWRVFFCCGGGAWAGWGGARGGMLRGGAAAAVDGWFAECAAATRAA